MSRAFLLMLCVFYSFYDTAFAIPQLAICTSKKLEKSKRVKVKIRRFKSSHTSRPCDAPADKFWLAEGKIRGKSSARFPKKQYSMKFIDKKGKKQKTPMLGMPASNHWVFNGPFVDRSYLRNVTAFAIGRQLAKTNKAPYFAPQTRFSEVYLNNKYLGLYVIIEKIKREPHKIPLPKVDYKNLKDLSFAIEVSRGENDFHSRYFTPFNFVYPKPDSKKEKKALLKVIKRRLHPFEKALRRSNIKKQEWLQYVDISSLVDYILVQEVFKNLDGFRRSAYLYYLHKANKFYFGPIWDFNLSAGNFKLFRTKKPSGWLHKVPHLFLFDAYWFKNILKDAQFKHLFKIRYRSLRKNLLSDLGMTRLIDGYAKQIQRAAQRDSSKWQHQHNFLTKHITNTSKKGNNPKEHIQILKTWLLARLKWMDSKVRYL